MVDNSSRVYKVKEFHRNAARYGLCTYCKPNKGCNSSSRWVRHGTQKNKRTK